MGGREPLEVVPANQVDCGDLARLFGERGQAANCWCQRYKLAQGEAFRKFPVEERAGRLRQQTSCGQPGVDATSGIVAFAGGEPVGWCAVEPRPAYSGLVRNARVPWDGRDEDKDDDTVWALTCVFIRPGHRNQGIGRRLVAAAVDHACERGARALEGYPMTESSALVEELHVGTIAMFTDAGLVEVTRPTKRRAVVRIDF
jgi:GNAT superfamily N-acetyltransferase